MNVPNATELFALKWLILYEFHLHFFKSSCRGFPETSIQGACCCLGGFTTAQEGDLGRGGGGADGLWNQGEGLGKPLYFPVHMHMRLQLSVIKLNVESVCVSRFRSAISPRTSPQTQSKYSRAEKSTVSAPGGPPGPGQVAEPLWAHLSMVGWHLPICQSHSLPTPALLGERS